MGKILRNLFGILLIATAVAVTQIPVSDVEAVTTSSASEFQMDGTTLVKYNGTAEDVSVPSSVKRIEAEAFAGNDYIRYVTISKSVEEIGASAFAGCKYLESVTIPDSVTTIEHAAFSRCPSLSKVTIGTGLSELGNGAFAGDYSLASVSINSKNSKFTCNDGAIYSKSDKDTLYQLLAGRKDDEYAMPSSVEKIMPYAFWGNYNLEYVRIGSKVKTISAYAFSNCKNLKEVEVSYSVKSIDLKAFEDCVRLREIEIPLSVSSIHATAFDGCTKLKIKADPGTVAYNFAQTLVLDDIEVSEYEEAPIPYRSDSTVSGNLASDGEEDSQNIVPDYKHEVTHMNPLEKEQDESVKGKTRVIGRQAVVLIDNANASVNVGGTGEVLGSMPEYDIDIPQYADTVPGLAGSGNAKGGSFPKYTIVNNSVIAAQAYYDDDMIAYDIPDGIVSLGEFSFARSNLRAIRIPDSVEEIGYAAFYHCDELTDVVIPSSVKDIAAAAFTQTPWLTNWKQSGDSDYLIVGDGILLAYKGNDNVVSVPTNVKRIGAEAFKDCTNIQKVILPDSVEVIGEAAFEGCSNLAEIEGGNQVREIRDRAFAGCPIITVRIPASVEKIGLRAYDSTDSTQSADSGVIVFGGEKLPKLSYEINSTKVYHDAYRDLAFKGSTVAVIPESVSDLTGTVLGDDKAGFEGIICKVTNEAAIGGNGTLRIVGRQGSGNFPTAGETCLINGKTYVLEDGTEKLTDSSATQDELVFQGIDVRIDSSSLPQDGIAYAVPVGFDGNYLMTIQDSDEAKTDIGNAYKKLYGNQLPLNLCAYEINLTEVSTGVPITGLGKQSVEVTIPIPSGVGQDNLHVVCLDADGQLEDVEGRFVSADGLDAITFTAKHFSAYGIYNYSDSSMNAAGVEDGQAVFTSLGNKDDSPDTGDYSIHPKWFLCIGLIFSAMAVFFYRGGRRKVTK